MLVAVAVSNTRPTFATTTPPEAPVAKAKDETALFVVEDAKLDYLLRHKQQQTIEKKT